jgi:hypothetical protein
MWYDERSGGALHVTGLARPGGAVGIAEAVGVATVVLIVRHPMSKIRILFM